MTSLSPLLIYPSLPHRLLQDYQDHNPLSPASDQEAVNQSDLYAQYASRFGEIVQHNDPSQQEAARGEGGAEPSGTSGAVEGESAGRNLVSTQSNRY